MFIERIKKYNERKEYAFTMIEIVMGVVIIGILFAIAYPVWTNIQNAQHRSAVEQKLSQVAVLIEQEVIDNNGYVPKYVPNEILDDPISRDFTYEQRDRLEWCVTAKITSASLIPWGPSSGVLWFVSSDNSKPSSTVACGGTGYEPMEGSSAPWETPIITTPAITANATTWANTNNYARLTASHTAASCTLSNTDASLFSPDVALTYRIEVTNTTTGRSGTTITSSLTSGLSKVIESLPNFYPNDTYQVRVQAVCTVKTNAGYPYEYFGAWSPVRTGTITPFTVPAPVWNTLTTNVGVGNASTPTTFSANWQSPYVCPTGSQKRYTTIATLPGAASAAAQTVGSNTTSITNQALTQNRPGFRYAFALRAICDYTASGVNVNIQSPVVNRETRAALRPPTGTMTITSYTSPAANITVTPSGFTLNKGATDQFVCAAGNPVATLSAVDSAGVVYGSRTVAFGAVSDYSAEMIARNTVEKSLTLNAVAACSGLVDGLSQNSANSPNTAVASFPIRWKIPAIPEAPTGFYNNNLGVAAYDNDRLGWSAVTCTFDGVPQYQVRQVQKSSQERYAEGARPLIGGVTTTAYINLGNAQLNPLARVIFEVQARCTNETGQSAWTTWATGDGANWVTTLRPPSAPASESHDANSSRYYINLPTAATCPPGTSYQVYIFHDRTPNGVYTGWTIVANWSTVTTHANVLLGGSHGYYTGGNGRWRCAGVDGVTEPGPWGHGRMWVITMAHSHVYMSNPGRTPTVNGHCQWGGGVSAWRVYGEANFGWFDTPSKSYYNAAYWGRGWYEGSMTCSTPYANITSYAARNAF